MAGNTFSFFLGLWVLEFTADVHYFLNFSTILPFDYSTIRLFDFSTILPFDFSRLFHSSRHYDFRFLPSHVNDLH
ncbi:hypothetical protein [Marinifilum flexuosum]|uniref:hypothetical protein n=1 Tax=Marinifilum flexuosum TaxID=1117708 RepID=UPI0011C39A74|nr:hypothetical protein [Marinifilum flexuosum]